jgi:microcin C transport system permease protein
VPKTIRLTFKEAKPIITDGVKMVFNREREIIRDQSDPGYLQVWQQISGSDKDRLQGRIESRFLGPVDSVFIMIRGRRYEAVYFKQEVRFPYDPSKGHLMGIDGAGRDVFTRIIYGLRTSLTFGLLLVVCSMTLGIVAGSLQGYYGGILDITSQRFIEIWSALPFLYIMILMGSVYGRSFSLLLFCYGLFNWIGISYYVRAEFLRLRRQAFVEASKCMGVSAYKIIFKHILPNALVPVITFLPFSLVGAIGALAALDYLGFGLPPPTPSWGELLFQAQQYRWAWWLILYPSLALFTVMLLGVFVGEGIRNAYDPKRYTRLE